MMFEIKNISLTPNDIDTLQVRKYLGDITPCVEVTALIYECINLSKDEFSYKICYTKLPVTVKNQIVDFGCFAVSSVSLCKTLKNCKEAIIFTATVGLGIDRIIRRFSTVSPSKALCFQAIGTERIEALCDKFESYLKLNNDLKIKKRFSPGYGDLPIEFQSQIFKLLDCRKNIGVTLTESLLMLPSKSVSAIIGITEEKI